MSRWWLAVGPKDNWEAAFNQGNTWGVKSAGRPALMWEAIVEGDRLLFYVTLPISGVIGYGTVRRKFRQNSPLWPQEVKARKSLWPLRLEFDVDYALPPERWQEDRVSNEAVRTLARGGFQAIDDPVALETVKAFPVPVGGVAPSTRQRPLHDELRDKLVEAGRLQGYASEKEYPMEKERLDAVWRRVARSVPTYVFEVQVGGDLYHALGKLKHAYDIWNSRIFLVAQEKDRRGVEALLSGTFHEIQPQLRFIDAEKLQELYDLKLRFRDLERELGLL